MKLLYKYKNGNYEVELYDDGTKIKRTDFDSFDASFPDSMDLKITNYCDMNCPMCHESSSVDGSHGNLNEPFLDKLQAGTELAIGGGNPLSHPDLIPFLKRMKVNGIVCNMTINEKHLLSNMEFVQSLIDEKLIYGLGLSLNIWDDKTLEFARKNSNAVFHLILGIVSLNDLRKLYKSNYKVLLLGYKKFGRGEKFYQQEMEDKIIEVKDNLFEVLRNISVVSFDNLAIKQLDVANKIGQELFEQMYMGDDGESTMYVDLVKRQFAMSSTSVQRYDLLGDNESMFKVIKKTN